MTTANGRIRRLLVAVLALAMVAAACGGSGDSDSSDGAAAADEGDATEIESNNEPVADEDNEIVIEAEEQPVEDEPTGAEEEEAAVIPPPSGELRIAGAAPLTSFNPAAVNSAQFGYLIPVYDTLTRQSADLRVLPGLATSWTRPDANTWEFTVRDDVVFHDGTAFDAQVTATKRVFSFSWERRSSRSSVQSSRRIAILRSVAPLSRAASSASNWVSACFVLLLTLPPTSGIALS